MSYDLADPVTAVWLSIPAAGLSARVGETRKDVLVVDLEKVK